MVCLSYSSVWCGGIRLCWWRPFMLVAFVLVAFVLVAFVRAVAFIHAGGVRTSGVYAVVVTAAHLS